jgi:hypothetical protein
MKWADECHATSLDQPMVWSLLLVFNPAALQDIPHKRVCNGGMLDITEESELRPLALRRRSAILPR